MGLTGMNRRGVVERDVNVGACPYLLYLNPLPGFRRRACALGAQGCIQTPKSRSRMI